MHALLQDLRFAFRQLLKSPGFTSVTVLTLALGIGATTAIVSIVKTAVFDPLPVRHPERLVQVGYLSKEHGWSPGINPAALRELRQQTNLFALVVAHYHWEAMTLQGEDFPQLVPGAWVTPGFFGLWNLRPLWGRTFTTDEGRPGKDDVMVISYRFWQHQFGGDPTIIGRTIPFRERPMTILGVLPSQFAFPDAGCEYWRPVQAPPPGTDEYLPNTQVIAEMQPGIQFGQVQSFLDVVTRRQGQQFLQGRPSWFPFQVRELRDLFSTPELRRALGLVTGAILLVLLIAAANITNLQLARTETRAQELAVRTALGASRARVFRQLFTESLLLAVLGGAAGLAVTASGLDLLQAFIPTSLPRIKPITLDLGVLAVASGVTLSTSLLFGLAPALRGLRASLSEVLKLGAVTSTQDRHRGWFSRLLIVGQVASVLVLLAGAGLVVRSVMNLLRVNPNLEPQHLVRVYPSLLELERRKFNPDPALNKAPEAAFAFFADAQQHISALPGVTAVGVGFEGREMDVTTTPSSPPGRMQKYWIGVEEADPLRIMRVPLRQGRWLDRSDAVPGFGRVLVNEIAARQLWPGEDAVGKRFWAREGSQAALAYEVVGVVGDTRDYSRYAAPQLTFYRALAKDPGIDIAPSYLVVRTAIDPHSLRKEIGRALKAAGADPLMPQFIYMQDALRAAMAGHRTVMLYLTIFAGVGLLLAAIGLYGVLSYSVARRTREIGIRMALGAQTMDMMWLILGQGFVLVLLGSAIGLAVALASGQFLRAYLFGIGSTDPYTFIAIVVLLELVALFACWLPARRAAAVDPMIALRCE
jgi:putative ABC transport system permease protein